jgi:hypothetical protein
VQDSQGDTLTAAAVAGAQAGMQASKPPPAARRAFQGVCCLRRKQRQSPLTWCSLFHSSWAEPALPALRPSGSSSTCKPSMLHTCQHTRSANCLQRERPVRSATDSKAPVVA